MSHEMLKLSRAIMRSRQYSQLHAVIISKNQNALRRDDHIAELAGRLKLPVILLLKRARAKKTSQPHGVEQYELEINGEQLHVSAKGISFKEMQELFTVGCAPGSYVPEAVRVVDLITKQGLCLLESQQ
jgi:cyanophycinase-like exopeptidase